jgi:DNA polymerase I-like protein with 3'-5' exonuclease and polymerase domains
VFPEIRGKFKVVGADYETNGKGYGATPVGFSLSTPDGADYYFAWGHERGGNNCSLADFMQWQRREFAPGGPTAVFHNAGFDLRVGAYVGVEFPGRVEDTITSAALLNELEPSFALGALAKKAGLPGKDEKELNEFCARAFGGRPTRDAQIGNYHRAPGNVVAPYAKSDSRATLGLHGVNMPRIKEEGLDELYELETAQLPLLLKMHMHGVRIDEDKARRVHKDLVRRLNEARVWWIREVGEVNLNSTQQLARVFDLNGLPYGRTEKGAPSITKETLESLDHPVPKKIREIRFLEKMTGTFINNYILKNVQPGGLIHGEFHPLKNEEYGTVSGRYSSGGSLNLQNMPARDEEVAPIIRGMFVPYTDGHLWMKNDYSQIEYRFFAHYAGGEILRAYLENAHVDFHQLVSDLTGIPRKRAKNVNFAKLYGAGVAQLAVTMGMYGEEGVAAARELVEEYERRIPEAAELSKAVTRKAENTGRIRTWGGRIRRFPLNPYFGQERTSKRGKKYVDRNRFYGTYAALNALLQGSAADMIKRSMARAAEMVDWKNTFLHLTVHDELDFSVPKGEEGEKFGRRMKEMMEDYDLACPVIAESEIGEDWGHTEKWLKEAA